MIKQKRRPTGYMLRTSIAFRGIRRLARFVEKAPCAFTFQTQSLFDASTPGAPHFVYTDHACAANRRYSVPAPADSGGTSDRVRHGATGFLVESGDVSALADALAQLLSNQALRQQMGNAGRELALRDFTWPAVGKRIAEHIRGVLA